MTDLGSPDPPWRGIGAALLVFAIGALAFGAWLAWPMNDPEPPSGSTPAVSSLADSAAASRPASAADSLPRDGAPPASR